MIRSAAASRPVDTGAREERARRFCKSVALTIRDTNSSVAGPREVVDWYVPPRSHFDVYCNTRGNDPGAPIAGHIAEMSSQPLRGHSEFERAYKKQWRQYLAYVHKHAYTYVLHASQADRRFWEKFEASVTPDTVYNNVLWHALPASHQSERFDLLACHTGRDRNAIGEHTMRQWDAKMAVDKHNRTVSLEHASATKALNGLVVPWLDECVEACKTASSAVLTRGEMESIGSRWGELAVDARASMTNTVASKVMEVNEAFVVQALVSATEKFETGFLGSIRDTGPRGASDYIRELLTQTHTAAAKFRGEQSTLMASNMKAFRAIGRAAVAKDAHDSRTALLLTCSDLASRSAAASRGWGLNDDVVSDFASNADVFARNYNDAARQRDQVLEQYSALESHVNAEWNKVMVAIAGARQVSVCRALLTHMDTLARDQLSMSSAGWNAFVAKSAHEFIAHEIKEAKADVVTEARKMLDTIYTEEELTSLSEAAFNTRSDLFDNIGPCCDVMSRSLGSLRSQLIEQHNHHALAKNLAYPGFHEVRNYVIPATSKAATTGCIRDIVVRMASSRTGFGVSDGTKRIETLLETEAQNISSDPKLTVNDLLRRVPRVLLLIFGMQRPE